MAEDYVGLVSCGYCQGGQHDLCDGRSHWVAPPGSDHRGVVGPHGIGTVPMGGACFCAQDVPGDDFFQPRAPHRDAASGVLPRGWVR